MVTRISQSEAKRGAVMETGLFVAEKPKLPEVRRDSKYLLRSTYEARSVQVVGEALRLTGSLWQSAVARPLEDRDAGVCTDLCCQRVVCRGSKNSEIPVMDRWYGGVDCVDTSCKCYMDPCASCCAENDKPDKSDKEKPDKPDKPDNDGNCGGVIPEQHQPSDLLQRGLDLERM